MDKSETSAARPKRPPSARLCAAYAVQHVLRDQEQLDFALSRQPDYSELSPRDRAFARLISATVFRRIGQIDAALKPFVKRTPAPLPHAVLRTGAAQLLFLKTPIHAAVGESVALLKGSPKTRAYSGMVNAVLRKVAEQGHASAASVPPSANIPGWIRASWEKAYGKPAMRRMAAELAKEPPLDIYVKNDAERWAEALEGSILSSHVLRRESAGRVSDLPGFGEGEWWVQDIAASLPVTGLGDVTGNTVLDMCAAPGGKTLQLVAAGAQVTALDKSPERMERVRENLARTKLSAEIITQDALEWAESTERQYDIVMLDAPCSATGTYRRHPDVLQNRTPKDVGSLVRLQKRLIKSGLKCLKPGGLFLYCTCSLQPEEGEGQIDFILQTSPDLALAPFTDMELRKPADFMHESGYMRILPHSIGESGGADGFFAVLFQKSQ